MRKHEIKSSSVKCGRCLVFMAFMVEKADSQRYVDPKKWEVERGKFYDPVRSLLKSKNQEINRLQLAVKLPWAIFFESVDILS
ncbi:hypothetical protein TNCV_434251 [Trichonephila clavipes]|nr:hypothetical protein TNCV_434251 [Trichonephila clavipes]